jgi:AAA+ superfamily predicted ATPase
VAVAAPAPDLAAVADAIGRVATRLAQMRAGQAASGGPVSVPAIDPAGRLARLAQRAALDDAATQLLRALAAAESDALAYRDLQKLGGTPTDARGGIEVGALVTLSSYLGVEPQAALAALTPEAPLTARGLVVALRDDGPLIGRRVGLAPRVLAYLRGPIDDEPRDVPLRLEPAIPLGLVVAAAGVVDRAQRLWPGPRALWLSGVRGVGKRTLLAALAASRGERVAVIDYRDTVGRPRAELAALLWREALLLEAWIVIANVAEATGDPQRTSILLYEALVAAGVPAVFTSIGAPTLGDFDNPPTALEIPMPDGKTRVALWMRELADVPYLEEVAARYRLPPGRVVRVSAAARELGRREARAVMPIDVTRSVSAEVAQKVTVLGTKIDDAQGWDDVVLPEQTLDSVKEIIARARNRHRVLHDWGFERKLAKGLGLSALFSGPPGTGKTMIAGIIARELALELYQIDLSRVVSKYVGETEKNLAEVFEAADWGNVLLLFDEADALFSKRTDVKSSNDRFSNMEINYLLQRLERFEGVSILTTNLEGSIDQAFKRRLSFRVQFPMPDAVERETLWRRMVPKEAVLEAPLDFATLATKYEFTGGNIRNAMLRAAFLAASEDRGITTEHVHRAVVLEYHDAGQIAIGGKLNQ